MEAMEGRAAQPQDAAGIAAVYNEGIEDGIATFETRLSGPVHVMRWIDGGERMPVVVAVEDEEVGGWARLTAYSERPCYAGVAEASVYVARAARGRGLGRVLLEALHREAERRAMWKVIGLLFDDNRHSVELFHRLGYRDVGLYRRHGRLNGRWKDVLLVERLLGEAARDAS